MAGLGMLDAESLRAVTELPELETVNTDVTHHGPRVFAGRGMNRRQRRALAKRARTT